MHPTLIPEARLPGYVGTNKYPETTTTCSDFRSLPLEQWGLKRAHHPPGCLRFHNNNFKAAILPTQVFAFPKPPSPYSSLASGAAGKLPVPGRCRGADWC